MITHVLFDLDGVLIDSENCYKTILNRILAKYGHSVTRDIFQIYYGKPFLDGLNSIIKHLNLPLDAQQFVKQIQMEYQSNPVKISLNPGVEKFVADLKAKGIQMAIATGATKDDFLSKTAPIKKDEFFKEGHYFHHVVTGADDPGVAQNKPAPDIYKVCAERFDDPPQSMDNCLVFEDSGTGVEAAKRAGMKCVMIPDPDLDLEALAYKPDLVITSFELISPSLIETI